MSWLSNSRATEVPKCFGESWDKNATECAGGADPAYTDERGNHVRRPCQFFDACGSRTQAARMEEARKQIVPTTSLTRAWAAKPATPVVNPQPVGGTQQAIHQFTLQQQQQQLHAQMMAMQNRAMAEMQRQGVSSSHGFGFQQMMPVNYEMPQYLTVREARDPRESVFKMLGREIFRSVMKSAGHTVANFFDSTPLRETPKKE